MASDVDAAATVQVVDGFHLPLQQSTTPPIRQDVTRRVSGMNDSSRSTSPASLDGGVRTPGSLNSNGKSGKSKKPKPPRRATAHEPNLCSECKTTDSKLWRRGPSGQLMCNACGLRWRRNSKPKPPQKDMVPRKRKATSVHAAAAQPASRMALPQSSMVAAKKGAIYRHASPSGDAIFIPTAASQKTFVYQPQNMFLHQQQQMAQEAQFREQKENALDGTLANENNKDADNDGHMSNTLTGLTDPRLLQDQQSPLGTEHAFTGDGDAKLPSDLASLHTLTQFNHHENGSITPGITASSSPANGVVHSNILPDDSSPPLIHNDDTQTDDFSSLLSLKAFVDDTGRQF